MSKQTKQCLWLVVIVLVLVLLTPLAASFQPTFVKPAHVDDHVLIKDAQSKAAYYGQLQDNPHSYALNLNATTSLTWQLLVPVTTAGETKPNALMVVKKEAGGVTEVLRVTAAEATWSTQKDYLFNDDYIASSAQVATLAPGEYLFEVSTPDNRSKYVLLLGEEQSWSPQAAVSIWSELWQVKQFFAKPWWAAWQAPLYYVPSLALLTLLSWYYYRRRFYA